MKIGLVAMSGLAVRTPELAALGATLPGLMRRGQVIARLPSLGLITVAGLTPYHHQVEYPKVADVAAMQVTHAFDRVAISSLTAPVGSPVGHRDPR